MKVKIGNNKFLWGNLQLFIICVLYLFYKEKGRWFFITTYRLHTIPQAIYSYQRVLQ